MYAEYLQTIAERLEPYFDLFWGERVAGKSMDLVAKFKMRNEKYFFSKRITLYAYENHETVLVQRTGEITPAKVRDFCAFLQEAIEELIVPSDEHMSSTLTGVLLVGGGVDDQVKRLVENFRYSRSFRFFLQGWCELRLLLVDLTTAELYTNKAGRSLREAYRVPGKGEVKERCC